MTSTFLLISAFVFCLGIFLVISKQNLIMLLIGIELIFNAANLNLVAFAMQGNLSHGPIFVLFNLIIAACEAAVALSIIINMYRYYKTMDPAALSQLNG